MRGYFDNELFGGHFGPRFGGMSRPPNCPFRGDFPGHHGTRPGFGPFGRFEHSPERHEEHQHGPEHNRRGDEDGHRGRRCGENDCDGVTGPSGRPHGFHDHGPSCRGHRPSFGRGPERHGHHEHGNEHQKPTEDNHRGRRCGHHGASDSDSDGPEGHHCRGPPGFRGRGGRPHGFHGHGPSRHGPRSCFGHSPERHCFGRRGPCDFPDRPFRGPWEGPSIFDHPMNKFGRHGPSQPWFAHRRPCPYNSEDRPSRKSNCEKCRETEPCCSGDKENRGRGKGRKENRPCCDKDKEQNVGDTVFVQRIVLEKATRPQSV